ncbi:MAG: Asp-tRNA(Asn)/Glu-tRNA(Gln) amidotransferase subunit GatB [Clostridiales bacterium]|nr:Asp-tRNA(Asn)/Glu-tRNA(Gln) amidotransferase subunit GatB [Clostridiales bacterium]
MKDYETIIGLEVHIELNTNTKLFCSCSTEFGAMANTNVCPICMGMPGTLPVLNEKAIELAVKAGKIFNANINTTSRFDRKNYFYPDSPKGYQITQMDMPICSGGYYDIEMEDGKKRINIDRIHIEEDAGKLIHLKEENISLVDYNRAGIPLIEIVTGSDFRSADEVILFLKDLRAILQYTGISDGKMEEGSLRCDVNISMRAKNSMDLNKKVEIKNLNSFREVYRALIMEEEIQEKLYAESREDEIKEETKRWDETLGENIPMRSKDDEQDYRYFIEGDLLDIHIEEDFIKNISEDIAELPNLRRKRIIKEYNIPIMQVDILMENKIYIDYFEEVVSYGMDSIEAANWITVDILRILKEREITDAIPINPSYLAKLINLIKNGDINRNVGKKILDMMVDINKDPETLVQEMGLIQISDIDELEKVVGKVIVDNPEAVDDYKKGKSKALGYFMGQIMKATKGKANPPKVKKILERKLDEIK